LIRPAYSNGNCLAVAAFGKIEIVPPALRALLHRRAFASKMPLYFPFFRAGPKPMTDNPEFLTKAAELIDAGRFIDRKGWVPATSGNFSARLSDGTIAITVSGKHKGHLQLNDIMRVGADGRPLDGKKPSAETMLHTSLYRRFPDAQAVLHPHSLNATLVSRLFGNTLVLENYELLKALSGIDTHAARTVVPIFANDQNIPRLAQRIEDYLDGNRPIYAYIIAGHGFYTWGASVQDALRHLEALEFLFDCEIRLHGVTRK
jgi:methylthioribulose-1-phosphate dehydratase